MHSLAPRESGICYLVLASLWFQLSIEQKGKKASQPSYEDKCHSSSGNQLVNAFKALTMPHGTYIVRPFGAQNKLQRLSSRACRVCHRNYSITKLNLMPCTSGSQGRDAFDPTKSFNNWKLLSQICLRTELEKWGGNGEQDGAKSAGPEGALPAYLSKHFSHFGVVLARDQIFKGIRREPHSEFAPSSSSMAKRYRLFAPLHSKLMSLSAWLRRPHSMPSISNPIIFTLCSGKLLHRERQSESLQRCSWPLSH